jgi:multidrug efflux pump subunit AcrB
VFILIILIAVGGGISYFSLPREAAPDVKTPWILINTTYEGVSPEDIENTITKEIEKDLAGLSGLKEIKSASTEGKSSISCEFLPGVNIDDALRRVKDKVDIAEPRLPTDEQRKAPTVTEINIAELPIMMINIAGDISAVRLKTIADELEDHIKAIDGVLDVEIFGALEREIRIEIDQERVAAFGLELDDVIRRIRAENVNISAGGLETPGMKFNIRVPAQFVQPDRIAYIPLTNVNGTQIYLRDVGEIRDTFKDRLSYSRLDGQESITVAVKKRVGANVLKIAEKVKFILDEARKEAPKSVRFVLTMDRSDDINIMVDDLENSILSALVLVVVVMVAFMGLRSSLIVATAIPLSMLMTFAIIWAIGYTLNMIVLFSLVLALGMLVDNAIVIVENIYRHRQLGMGKIEAAMKGTGEVAWPVITSTLTTVVAFLPITFMPGLMGDFMKYLPITVIIALSSSLFVAMVISPVLSCVGAARAERKTKGDNWFVRGYSRFLAMAINHRFATLAVSLLLLIAISATYMKRGFRVEFFPDEDPREAVINIRNPQGTNILETDRIAGILEHRVEKHRNDGNGENQIEHLVVNTGSSGGFRLVGTADGPHVGNLTVMFPKFLDRKRPSTDTVNEIRQDVADIAGGEIKVEKQKHGPPTGAAVSVQIIGEDFKELEKFSEKARKLIEGVPNLINLSSDLESRRPELVFRVSRERAKKLGVDTTRIGVFLQMAVRGLKAASFRQFNDEYDITVRLPLEQRTRIDELLLRRIPTVRGKAIPLSSLGYFEYVPGHGTIFRINEKRVVTLTGDAEGRLGTEVLKDVQERLSKLGRSRLIAGDISDWKKFCALLSAGKTEVESNHGTDFLRELGSGTKGLIRRWAENGKLSDKEKNAVVKELNKALASKDLIRGENFRNVELGEEAQGFLKRGSRDLSNDEVMRTNRLLLEAAYPSLIAASRKLDLPRQYRITYAGEKEHQDEATAFLQKAFGFALLLIALVLVAQFNTLSVPLIIMTTVILSTTGVFVSLLIFDKPFGVIMTGIGVISLAGVVVNNAIVLLDYTRKLQQRGLDIVEASIRAGMTRLRPVLLTAGTTVLGLVPMATGYGIDFKKMAFLTRSESSQWWSGMATAVIFGLGFATVLTLVVVPSLYVTLYRLAARFGLGGLVKPEAPLAAQPEVEDF